MKTKLAVLLILIFAINSCSSAQVTRGKVNMDAFTKIACNSGIDVYFSHSNSHTIEVVTDEENLSKIEIQVKDNALKIQKKEGEKFKNNTEVKVYVTAPVLNDIALSGGSDFYSKELKNDGQLNIAFSGGADLEIDRLDARKCNIAFSGGADCEIKQLKAKSLALAFSGGSDGNIGLDSADNVSVGVSGGADLVLSGKANTLNVSVSGGADVDIRNLTAENITTNKGKNGTLKR